MGPSGRRCAQHSPVRLRSTPGGPPARPAPGSALSERTSAAATRPECLRHTSLLTLCSRTKGYLKPCSRKSNSRRCSPVCNSTFKCLKGSSRGPGFAKGRRHVNADATTASVPLYGAPRHSGKPLPEQWDAPKVNQLPLSAQSDPLVPKSHRRGHRKAEPRLSGLLTPRHAVPPRRPL